MSNASRSESRDDYIVRVAAIHTTEGTSYTAAELRDADWWEGSAHAIFDDTPDEDPAAFTKNDTGEVTPLNGGVPYDKASWTLRSGNRWSVNAELVGYASWTREQWLDRPRQLNRVALWLTQMHKLFDIPLQKITWKQYKAGAHGVIGHIDHTEAFGGPSGDGGTHWDPGPGFPYDVVIAKAKAYLAAELEPNMTPEQAKKLDDIYTVLCTKVIGGRTLADALRVLITDKHPSGVEGSTFQGTIPRFVLGTHELVSEVKDLVLTLVPAAPPAPAKTTAAKK